MYKSEHLTKENIQIVNKHTSKQTNKQKAPGDSVIKNLTMQETQVQSLTQEDPTCHGAT